MVIKILYKSNPKEIKHSASYINMVQVIVNEIQQPRPFDLVNNLILISGNASGFEATINCRVQDGNNERISFVTVGGATGEHGQFQLEIDLSDAGFQLDRLFVEIFEIDANDGSEINKVIVPVIYGPQIIADYFGYRLYEVNPGDTLSRIANINYGDDSRFNDIVRANPTIISDPNIIIPGQVLKIPIGQSSFKKS